MKSVRKLLATNAPAAVILVRLVAGAVFLSEGIQKFLFPDALGSGRFAKIGIPAPEFFGPFVGTVEIVCGGLIIVGFLTRLATVPLLIDMVVAIVATKIPMLAKSGFWSMAHEVRVDFSMLLACLFLLLVGAGTWSIDTWLTSKRTRPS
jgi:putative oxidoreductase